MRPAQGARPVKPTQAPSSKKPSSVNPRHDSGTERRSAVWLSDLTSRMSTDSCSSKKNSHSGHSTASNVASPAGRASRVALLSSARFSILAWIASRWRVRRSMYPSMWPTPMSSSPRSISAASATL